MSHDCEIRTGYKIFILGYVFLDTYVAYEIKAMQGVALCSIHGDLIVCYYQTTFAVSLL